MPITEEIPQYLLNVMQSYNDVITHQKALIAAKVACATSLPPPYEPIDEATQAGIDQQALTCRNKRLLAVQKDASAQELMLVQNVMIAIYRHREEQARQQADKEKEGSQLRQQVIDAHSREAREF